MSTSRRSPARLYASSAHAPGYIVASSPDHGASESSPDHAALDFAIALEDRDVSGAVTCAMGSGGGGGQPGVFMFRGCQPEINAPQPVIETRVDDASDDDESASLELLEMQAAQPVEWVLRGSASEAPQGSGCVSQQLGKHCRRGLQHVRDEGGCGGEGGA